MLVVLVDAGPRLEEGLHEQVQEGRHADLQSNTPRVGPLPRGAERGPRQGRPVSAGSGAHGPGRRPGGRQPSEPQADRPAGAVARAAVTRKATHELHGRRVHAREHLEQDGDVGRVQGPFGQHGPQGLASPGVGGRCAQGQRDLTGVVASGREEHTAVTPQAGPVPTSLPRLRLCVAGAPGLSRGSVSPGTLTTACAVTTTLHTRLADLEGGQARSQHLRTPSAEHEAAGAASVLRDTDDHTRDHRTATSGPPSSVTGEPQCTGNSGS